MAGGIELGYRTPECVRAACVTWRVGWPCDFAAVRAQRRGWRAGRGIADCAVPMYILNVQDMTTWRAVA